MNRNYVQAEDLGFGPTVIYGRFLKTMTRLLKNIITPEFKSISDDFYIDNVVDINNNLLINCRIAVDGTDTKPNNTNGESFYDSNDFQKQFIKLYNQAISNISNKMTPIKEKELNNVKLSADQFVMNLISLEIYPNVSFFQEPGEIGHFFTEILFDIVLNIEEISELHPGGVQMLYLKYKNLCMDNSRYSLNELSEWVIDLGYKTNTKDKMCKMIKLHYDF